MDGGIYHAIEDRLSILFVMEDWTFASERCE